MSIKIQLPKIETYSDSNYENEIVYRADDLQDRMKFDSYSEEEKLDSLSRLLQAIGNLIYSQGWDEQQLRIAYAKVREENKEAELYKNEPTIYHFVEGHEGGAYISDASIDDIEEPCPMCGDYDRVLVSWISNGNPDEIAEKIIPALFESFCYLDITSDSDLAYEFGMAEDKKEMMDSLSEEVSDTISSLDSWKFEKFEPSGLRDKLEEKLKALPDYLSDKWDSLLESRKFVPGQNKEDF